MIIFGMSAMNRP